jgi:hypothetical protein
VITTPLRLLVGVSCLACTRTVVLSNTVEDGRGGSPAPKVGAASFAIRVDRAIGGSNLVFDYPDRPTRTPSIALLSITKVGDKDIWCEMHAKNPQGPLIERRWRIGSIPANYSAVGCKSSALSSGEYELQAFTDRGEFRQKIRVSKDGLVSPLPWDLP